ncbi:MAG: cell division protein SepF [Clostridia bacterium]|nr:cell division protein SepF [Clostridia bacterium]
MGAFLEYLQGEQKIKRRKPPSQDVSTISPKNFGDLQLLLDSLKKNEGLVVDFENTDAALAQRMLDFLSGAVYALDARIEQIKSKMYMLLPKGLNIKTKLQKGQK